MLYQCYTPVNMVTATAITNSSAKYLIHINPLTPQLFPCYLNFAHQLLICLWHIIERKNPPAKLKEEIGTERYEGPEGELIR